MTALLTVSVIQLATTRLNVLDRQEEEEQTEHTWRPGDSCSGIEFIVPDRQ